MQDAPVLQLVAGFPILLSVSLLSALHPLVIWRYINPVIIIIIMCKSFPVMSVIDLTSLLWMSSGDLSM